MCVCTLGVLGELRSALLIGSEIEPGKDRSRLVFFAVQSALRSEFQEVEIGFLNLMKIDVNRCFRDRRMMEGCLLGFINTTLIFKSVCVCLTDKNIHFKKKQQQQQQYSIVG